MQKKYFQKSRWCVNKMNKYIMLNGSPRKNIIAHNNTKYAGNFYK